MLSGLGKHSSFMNDESRPSQSSAAKSETTVNMVGGTLEVAEINQLVSRLVADGVIQAEQQEAIRQDIQQVRGQELIQLVLAYPQYFSSERLSETVQSSLEPETNASLLLELLQRGETGVVEQLLSNFSPANQERLGFVVRKLREAGVEFSLPSDEQRAALQQYNAIDLEEFNLENIGVPEPIQLNERERRVVFHGTRSQHVDSLKRGMFSVSPTYKMVTKNIQAALDYKTGLTLETVSDGTITIWDPLRSQLGDGDRVAYPIIQPIDETSVPQDLPKPKNSRLTKYRFGLPAESFCGSMRLTPTQMEQIRDMRRFMSLITQETAPPTFLELISNLQQQIPGEIEVEWSDKKSNTETIAIKKVMSVLLYESELKSRAQACTSLSPAAIEHFQNFPTYDIPGYDKYKKEKLRAMLALK